jgi:hypothetical protein
MKQLIIEVDILIKHYSIDESPFVSSIKHILHVFFFRLFYMYCFSSFSFCVRCECTALFPFFFVLFQHTYTYSRCLTKKNGNLKKKEYFSEKIIVKIKSRCGCMSIRKTDEQSLKETIQISKLRSD